MTMRLIVLYELALILGSCGNDEPFAVTAPYCQRINEDDEYCELSFGCRDDETCWYTYEGRRYDCTNCYDCDGAIDALLADSCW